MSRKPQHLATATLKTAAIEATFYTLFNKNTPDRDGRFRAETTETETQAAA